MALYLVCGSQHHHTYEKLARDKLSSLLSQPAVASLCAVEALDNNRLPHSGLLLLSEDDTAATDGVCELLQKLNLTVAPLIVQPEWQEDCLPGVLLFECPADPGDKYISDLRAKHLSIVACHRLSFTRRQRGQAQTQAKQFQVLMVQLSGGPQALNFERNLLARLICKELHLQQALYVKLSRPELADNPPYVPTVETRCLKTTFLLVRGSHSYGRDIERAFKPSFMLKHESGKHSHFALLYSIGKHSAATSIPERRSIMDKLMAHPNCRVDEVFVCLLDSASSRAPSCYAAPPVGVQCSSFLLIATDPWGPSLDAVREACCGISMSAFFTDGFARMALIHIPNQNDRISSALALISHGVQVYAVFLNDWIVNVELLPDGPIRQPVFSQSVRPDARSLVLHGPQPPKISEPQPKLQSPASHKPMPQPSQARPPLLPTPEPQPTRSPILPTPAQQLPSASPSPTTSSRPEEPVSAGPTSASSKKRPASEALPGSPTRHRRRDQADASSSDPDPIDLDPGSPMSIETENEASSEEGETEAAGEAAASASSSGLGGGPRTPPDSPENLQRSPSVASTGASSIAPTAASASPRQSPKPPPEPHLHERPPVEPEGDLMSNMCLEVSPLSVHVTRYDVEQLLQDHPNPNGEDWHFVLYKDPGRDFQQLLLFAENPGAELCRSIVQLRSGRSSRHRLGPPSVHRRSIKSSDAGARCPLPLRLAVYFEPRGLWICGLRPGQLERVLDCVFGRYRQVQTTDYQQQSVLLRFDTFGDCVNSYLRVSIAFLFRLACYLCLGCD